jgi:hypothetical protein
MAAGPNQGLTGDQAGAMGESWSDLSAMEILNEFNFAPLAGENRYAIGPYVTGDQQAGIRNYGMNVSPLNYSDVGYDFVCNAATCRCLPRFTPTARYRCDQLRYPPGDELRYDGAYPSSGTLLQISCAEGKRRPTSAWQPALVQLVFDACLLMAAGNVSMIDARDAMLAADLIPSAPTGLAVERLRQSWTGNRLPVAPMTPTRCRASNRPTRTRPPWSSCHWTATTT